MKLFFPFLAAVLRGLSLCCCSAAAGEEEEVTVFFHPGVEPLELPGRPAAAVTPRLIPSISQI